MQSSDLIREFEDRCCTKQNHVGPLDLAKPSQLLAAHFGLQVQLFGNILHQNGQPLHEPCSASWTGTMQAPGSLVQPMGETGNF